MDVFVSRKFGSRCWGGLLAMGVLMALAGCGSAPVVRPSGGVTEPPPSRPEAVAPPHAQSATLHALGLVVTPYRYGGNTPESGFDCSGLIAYVYREAAGIRTPRTVAELSGWGQPVPRSEVRTGDLAVFTVKGRTNHAGIYVGEGRFVHAPSTGGTVRLDRLDRGYWATQGLSFRRHE
jgi:cell wall-associated NlpC family hydrolase